MKFNFSALPLPETQCESLDSTKNLNIGFMDRNIFIKLEMVGKKEGSVVFLVTRYLMKIRCNLNVNSDAIECLCLELPPTKWCVAKLFEKHMKSILS